MPKDSRIDLQGKGLEALPDPSIQRIALANAEVAPYGRAAWQALERAGLLPALQSRIVTGQSVAQAAQFAALLRSEVARAVLLRNGHALPGG